MDPARPRLVTQGRALRLWLSDSPSAPPTLLEGGMRPLLSYVNRSTLGKGEEGLWVFITIWNVNMAVGLSPLENDESKGPGRKEVCQCICCSERFGQCSNTEKFREDCLPTAVT